MPSLSSNPRISGSSAGLTSLGAVGGPRGQAAAGARIIVDFVTHYDAAAVKQLEADLAQFTNVISTEEARRTRIVKQNINARTRFETGQRLAAAKIAAAGERGADERQLRKDLADAKKLALSPHLVDQREAKVRMNDFITSLNRVGVLTAQDERTLRRMLAARNTQLRTQRALEASAEREAAARKGQVATEQRLAVLRKAGALGAKFGALAIGAAGGILGSVVLGAVFTALEEGIRAVGEGIGDILDPLRKAREEFKEIGAEIRAITGEGIVSDLDRVKAWAKQYGLALTEAEERTLAYAAAVDRYVESYEKKKAAELAAQGGEGPLKDIIKERTNELIKQAKANNTLQTELRYTGTSWGEYTNTQFYAEQAMREVNAELNVQAMALSNQAIAAQRSAAATAYAAAAQQQFSSAITAAAGRQSSAIDTQIAKLPQTSARTRRLQSQLERAQQGGGGSSNAAALRDNAEERALILLRQRLRLMGTAINIDKYEGKFRLEAINMRIQALQNEAEAQDRVNRLLENRYKQSQEILRNEGESIKDYLSRRAQENRALLVEEDEIRRDSQIARLEKEKEVTEDEVALRENAEQRKQIAAQGTTSNYVSQLQKQLEASQKADQKAYERRKKELERQKKLNEQGVQDINEVTAEGYEKQYLLSIQGAKTLEELSRISGMLAGVKRAKSAIQALVEGFGLPYGIAAPFIAKMNGMINAWSAHERELANPHRGALAEGGIISLTNARNPFGSNVRVGEQGTELAVVLSNKVTNALARAKGGNQNIGPFYVQGSGDFLRDQFALKRVVKEAMAEVLR